MENELMPLYLVVSFEQGPYCAALYEIELGSNACEGLITPLIKLFPGYNERKSSSVGAEIEGSQICLVASVTTGNPSRPFKDPPRAIQIPPCVYDVETKVCEELDVPKGTKIFPTVVAAEGRGFYVLNGGPLDDFEIDPSFERLDSVTHAWNRSWLPDIPRVEVSAVGSRNGRLLGYVTVNDYIVISVGHTRHPIEAKYYSYKIGGDSDSHWIPLQMQGEHILLTDERFWGKAEFVEDAIYICTPQGLLIRYGVSFGRDGSIELLHFPHTLRGQDEFVALEDSLTNFSQSGFFHLGERKFCVMRTDDNFVTENGQSVEVFIVQVSEGMEVTLLHRSVYELCTIGLGLEGSIGKPKLVSLSVDGLMLQNKDLQAGNIDATKIRGKGVAASSASSGKRIRENAESLDGFLQSLGLEKYLTAFNEEEIDMAILPRITDEELKVMGLPIGARKKIRMELHSESIDTFLQRLGLQKCLTKFKDEEIDVACLSQMNEDDLKELGLPMGPRKKILSEFKSN